VAKRGFLITFPASLQDETGIHRIRNWAEDVFREVTRQRWGAVEDPDTVTDRLWVIAASPRVTGDLAKLITRTLKSSHLLDDAAVTKLATDEDWAGLQVSAPRQKRHDG
jgi:hypothetical protein